MGKIPEKFEDWQAPWGEDDFDADKAARLVYSARKAEEKAKEALSAVKADLQEKLDAAEAAKAGTDAEAQSELKDLRKKVREQEEALKEPRPADRRRIDQLEVAIASGLPLSAAGRLQGESREEIEADAKVYLQEIGMDSGDGEPETRGPAPSSRPKVHVGEVRTGIQAADAGSDSADPRKLFDALPPLHD